jgi:CRP/FNR family transcriptional regulator
MKRNKKACDLKSCTFCTGCLPEWLPAIAAARKTFDFKKGELLFEEGAAVTGIYFMVSGKVKVHKRWGPDKELIVRIAGDGEIVGHRGVGKRSVYPVSATALEPVTACFINLEFFQASLKVNTAYALELLLFFAAELQDSETNMRNLAHMQVKGRIATALLKLKEQFGSDANGCLNFQLSRQDLASFAGTTYETVFRILNELVADGLIEVAGKDITVLNKQGLLKCIEET